MKKKITAETICEMKFVSDPRFAPDGSALAFVVSSANEEKNGYKRDLWIVKGDAAPKALTSGGDAGSYCWTPEGTILFPARRSSDDKKKAEKKERFTTFYEISPDGGEALPAFTVPYAAGGLTHIDDQLYFFTAKMDKNYPVDDTPDREKVLEKLANPPYRPIDESPFWFNGAGFTYGTRSALYLFDRSTGNATKLTGDKFDTRSVYAHNGKLYYTGSEFESVRKGMNVGLYTYDIASGKTETVFEPNDDLRVMWARPRACGDVILAASKGEKFGLSESAKLYTMDLVTKQLTELGNDIHPCMNHVGSDARLGVGLSQKMIGDDLYYIDLVGYKNLLVHVDKSGVVHEDIAPVCGIDAFDICGDKLAYVEVYEDKTPEIILNGKRITNFGIIFDEYEVSTPEYIGFDNDNGDRIDGWMLKPAGYDVSKSYPALLEIHGGPRTAFGEAFFHEMQMFASAGYFVLFCNPRGSDGKGDAFADIWGKYGTIDYDDLMAFVDHALDVVPQIDKNKLGVLGGSYGGYMTNWIIGHTDRFKAAASQRSIANWVSFEFTSDIGATFCPSQHRTSTHENFDYLWDISPLKYADKAVTPTLFIHSDNDFRCWMVEGIQMFTALKYHGIDSRLCLFEGENHELSRSGKPENRISRLLEMQEWFAKYLGEDK